MIKLLCFILIFHGLSLVLGSTIIKTRDIKSQSSGWTNLLKADVIGAILLVAVSLIGVEVLGVIGRVCKCIDVGWYIWLDLAVVIIALVIYTKRSRIKSGSNIDGTNIDGTNIENPNDANARSTESLIKKSKPEFVLIALNVAIVLVQIAYIMAYANNSSVAYRPLRYATQYYNAGVIELSKPMMLLLGTVAKSLGMHPAAVGFMLAPIVLIPVYYGAYSLLMTEVSKKRIHKEIALVIISILHIWGYQSDLMLPANMIVTPYGGWVYLIDGLLPLLAYYFICKKKALPDIEKEKDLPDDVNGEEITTEDYCEEWDMKKHPIINARNLAIALGVTVVALVVLVFMLNNKINRLYDATVNLETALNSRCSIYEFCPQEGADPTGYLIKDSTGRLTMVGGGGIDDTDEIYDFIIQYGNVIDTWYVYGSEDADRGAYDGCVIYKDLEIKNVYEIERKAAEYNADSN